MCVFGGGWCRFILGPPDLKDSSNLGRIPRLYLSAELGLTECHLVVYRAHSANLCLLIHGQYLHSKDSCTLCLPDRYVSVPAIIHQQLLSCNYNASCLLGTTNLTIEHLRKLEHVLHDKMGGLASDIGDQYASVKKPNR